MSLYSIVLFIHVFLAIAVFGPTFTFPIWVARSQKQPQHSPFVLSVFEFLGERWILPGSVLLFLAGVLLIILAKWNLFTTYWLDAAIILYLVNFALALGGVRPITRQMSKLAEKMAQNPGEAAAREQIQLWASVRGKSEFSPL